MQCSVSSLSYTGDVTALCVVPPQGGAATPLLLAGIGSQLHVYALPAGHRACCAAVLPDAARLHGIAWLPAAACGGEQAHLLLAVHGGRHAALLSLLGPAPADVAAGSGAWEVRVLVRLPPFQPWTMDVQLSWAGSGGGGVHVAVGLSNNAVEAFHVTLPPTKNNGRPAATAANARRALSAAGGERCLLYSMALLPRQHGARGVQGTSWLVAVGSVFLDVLVWATPAAAAAAVEAAGGAASTAAPTLLRLCGHQGSIHRVRWSPCGRLLATASDDRSLRLWAIPSTAPADPADCQPAAAATAGVKVAAQRVLRGHAARLWDCCFGGGGGGGGGPAFLVTASEDCSCRVYCVASGQLLGVVQGHRGRGIWRCALLEPPPPPAASALAAATANEPNRSEQPAAAALAAALPCVLVTGGADGSVKSWRLADWLAGLEAAAAPDAAGVAAECCLLKGVPPPPAAAVRGSGAVYSCVGLGAAPLPTAEEQQQQLQQQLEQWQRGEGLSVDSGQEARQAGAAAAAAGDQRQGQPGGGGGPRDSSAEWVRCLALAPVSECGGGGAAGGGGARRRWRRRCLWLGTNQGLVHRVALPDAAAGEPESWVCLHAAAANGGRAPPITCLAVQPEAAAAWVAAADFGGGVVVLRDCLAGSCGPGPCLRWRPHGDSPAGAVGVWWGSPSRGAGVGGGRHCLGPRILFTACAGALMAWLLPDLGQQRGREQTQQQQQAQTQQQLRPQRLAEAVLPVCADTTALAAARLPGRHGPCGQAAALVAVGDSRRGVTLLLLLLPSWFGGSGGLATGSLEEVWGGTAEAVADAALLPLAATRRASDSTSVRAVQLQLPPGSCRPASDVAAAEPAELARLLAGAEVVAAGGDGVLRCLRLSAAAVAAAVAAIGAPEPAAADRHAAAALPPLLCAFSRRCEAVMQVQGVAGSLGGGGEAGAAVYGFHSDRFAVWDAGAEAEAARVPCGGWRRPWAADVAAADDLALCFVRDHRLWLYRRAPCGARGTAVAPRCLHPPHHGLEQECLRLLLLAPAAAPAAAPPALCCLTGGDDGLLRQQLLALPRLGCSCSAHKSGAVIDCDGTYCTGGGAFAAAAPVGEAPQGTAAKALALLRLPAGSSSCVPAGDPAARPPREWLLVAAGAKQSLVAYRLCQQPQQQAVAGRSCQPQPLSVEELAVNGPGGGPLRRAPNGGQKLESEQRYLAVSAFLWRPRSRHPDAAPDPCLLFAAAAGSDGGLALLCADVAQRGRPLGGGARLAQWRAAANLRHHRCPVLCTAHCWLQPDGDSGSGVCSGVRARHIICSGSTDGSAAAWDVTAAAAAAAESAAAAGAAQPAGVVPPLLALPGIHQSGINSMAAAAAGPGSLLLLTGGDDQALCFTLLSLPTSGGGSSSSDGSGGAPVVALRLAIPCAHSSAVRAVGLAPLRGGGGALLAAQGGGPHVLAAAAFSVGLDQQVRCWRVRLERGQGSRGAKSQAAEGGEAGGGAAAASSESRGRYAASTDGAALAVAEAGCRYTQVAEPAALDVVVAEADGECWMAGSGGGCQEPLAGGGAPRRFLVGVVGRGTEVMAWQLPALFGVRDSQGSNETDWQQQFD